MNRSKRYAVFILAFVVCLLALTACSAKKPENNKQAAALADELRANQSRLFSTIEGVDTLPAALCILVTVDKTAYFLQDAALPSLTPEVAEAVLLAKLATVQTAGGPQKGVYDCDLIYGTPDGGLSVTIAKDIRLEKGENLASLLKERFTFAEGEPPLPSQLAAYIEKLEAMDFATAIDASRDQYTSQLAEAKLDSSLLGEPLVYLTDAEAVCKPAPGNDLFSHPAEQGQYVPSWTSAYERPAIGGPIGVGFAGLGKTDGSHYTLQEVREKLESQPEAFCFVEVVGLNSFGRFDTSDGKMSYDTYTYEMRFSLIRFDGTLLGCRSLRYPGTSELSSLELQLTGNMMSIDKNGNLVLPWAYRSYRDAFFKAIE